MQLSDNARSILLMNAAMVTFTLNDVLMKSVTRELPLFQTIGLRGLISTLLLAALAWRMGLLTLRPSRRDASVVGLRTFVEVIAAFSFVAALTKMPLANLSAIMQVLPLGVTLGAALFFKESIGWRRMLAIGLGFLGVMIIVRPGPAGFDGWALLALGTVAAVTVRDLSTRSISRAMPAVQVALLATGAVTLVGLIGAFFEGWQPMGWRALVQILLAACFVNLAQIAMVATMRVGDISLVAPFRYMALLWAIVLGWAIFGEIPDGLTLFGAGLVVASGIFTLLRERRLHRSTAARAGKVH